MAKRILVNGDPYEASTPRAGSVGRGTLLRPTDSRVVYRVLCRDGDDFIMRNVCCPDRLDFIPIEMAYDRYLVCKKLA